MSRPNTPQTFQLAIQRNPEATKHRSCQSYVLLLLIVAIIVWWSVEAIVMPMSHREGAAVLPTTVTLVTITPAAVVATTMPTPTPTRVRDAEPSAISNATTTFCVHHAPYLCDNRGTDVCRWTTSELTEACGLTNFTNQAADTKMSPLAQALSNRRIVFHGDSTLREVFSAVVDAAAASAPAWNIKSRLAVDKRLTNMSSRAVIGRRLHTSANATVDFSFRFDYTIDHLNETIPDVEPSEGASLTSTSPTPGSPPPDAVVVGLGLYHARSIHRNTSIFVNMTTGQTTFRWGNPVPRDVVIRDAAASIQSLVCDRYGAKVGFFASTWLECGPLKPKKIKSATPQRPKHNNNYFDCTREHGHLRAIQYAIQEQLMAMPPRADGCAVHYVHPIKCTSQSKHACLFDGIHTRPGGHYAQSKGQVLLNSMITSWNHMA